MSAPLNALSPLDGRYRNKVERAASYFSEYAYINHRVEVEVEYFIALLLMNPPLENLKEVPVTENLLNDLRSIYKDFSMEDAEWVKQTEFRGGAPGGPPLATNHDVKAVEYFVKHKFSLLGENQGYEKLLKVKEFVHFGLTSQDINNTSFPLMMKRFIYNEYIPELAKVIATIDSFARKWAEIPMLARTHGQPASPTRMGKELMVFVHRLRTQLVELDRIPHNSKFGGATGNMNAHRVAYPKRDWFNFANQLISGLGLERLQCTTQIEHYDNAAAIFHAVIRINTILIDLCRDIWTYISQGLFKQRTKAGEIGSSAMPHKVNPIDFENAEGNLGIANAIFEHLARKLPISRLQRDLTDSTVTRNIGVPFGHSLVALLATQKGLGKLKLDENAFKKDLESHWEVTAEAIQTVLRREQVDGAYELLKEETRGAVVTQETINTFLDKLEANEDMHLSAGVVAELREITPFSYTGFFDVGETLEEW
eukprot:CAMPEP_0204831924 /NCGR_PEP_ID=MMETSP1346-20131115/12119_1 /ASSEMBLY_ACC=CAM_ASM_000771 /TAXON_ID=215587 /ORGANISM="Aplanochytrium stocchinoi, Strain GSBS06" /LENGTH=481 /DNA_ID=CAMNT_0051963367 /DNA_START=51 /DNA_END=1493 /DNA_ORIENTATION=-